MISHRNHADVVQVGVQVTCHARPGPPRPDDNHCRLLLALRCCLGVGVNGGVCVLVTCVYVCVAREREGAVWSTFRSRRLRVYLRGPCARPRECMSVWVGVYARMCACNADVVQVGVQVTCHARTGPPRPHNNHCGLLRALRCCFVVVNGCVCVLVNFVCVHGRETEGAVWSALSRSLRGYLQGL